MTRPHLVELMDVPWIPNSLRNTLREILECGNSLPLRPYYKWVADEALKQAVKAGYRNVVELGAGTAPITKRMAKDKRSQNLRLIICDDWPDTVSYQKLREKYPGRVEPIFEPVDFSLYREWEPKTLLVLSGAFHHLPSHKRVSAIEHMANSAEKILICEPLRRHLFSFLFVFGSLLPSLLLPLFYFARPGKMRRLFWCWLLPLAPFIFVWDGLVSCWRMWSKADWIPAVHRRFGGSVTPKVTTRLFSQLVELEGRRDQKEKAA